GLQGALFETGVEALLKELEDRYPSEVATSVQASSPAVTDIASTVKNMNELRGIIDVDEIEVVKKVANGVGKSKQAKWLCEGVLIVSPEGTNQHTLYPFGIHSERVVPWNYRSVGDKFYLQAESCQKSSSMEGEVCRNCQKLTSSTLYTRVMERIKLGAHGNTSLVYHGVGALVTVVRRKTDQIDQLRMSKLNDSRNAAEIPTSVTTTTLTVAPQVPSAPFTSTPQVEPSAPALGGVVGTRFAHALRPNACTCGVTITGLEIQEGKTVMKCHAPECETIWVRANVTFALMTLMLALRYLT
ncbi:hypothetical protein BJY52DRAFT_1241155, partial [Lactarius psammicola]